MTITRKRSRLVPDFWNVWGHSYMNFNGGSLDQTGRADALLRGDLDIEFSNFRNYAVNGAILWYNGYRAGNWSRIFNMTQPYPGRATGPYPHPDGASIMCFGINDIGNLGSSTGANGTRTAWVTVNRACISRLRAAVYFDSDATGNRTVYGAGFTNTNNGNKDAFTNGQGRGATTAVSTSSITITLPADYKGEPVALMFLGTYGGGGTVTFTGTAGVTGTLSTTNACPAASVSFTPIIKRVTNLTAANASQTIIATVSQIDASATLWYDGWWLEALAPAPVLVYNINRLTAAGYTNGLWANWNTLQPTEAGKDADVVAWNADLAGVVAEFTDGLVQIIDIDSIINKNAALTSDGIHPNEVGAGLIVDACIDVLDRMVVNTAQGRTVALNGPAPRAGVVRKPRIVGQWYTSDYLDMSTGTAPLAHYTCVLGDQFAMPFVITEARERYQQFVVEVMNAPTANTSWRVGLYDDVRWFGYPDCLITSGEPTSGTQHTSGTSAGVRLWTAGAGGMDWRLDPGLYWMAVKCVGIGATAATMRAMYGPSDFLPNLTSGGAGGVTTAGNKLMGWKHAGRGTTALEGYYPAGGVLSEAVPYVGLKLVA